MLAEKNVMLHVFFIVDLLLFAIMKSIREYFLCDKFSSPI
jgi:hypothetical protein